MTGLLDAPSAWVQLLDDDEGLTVLELDEAVVGTAPWEGFGVQLTVSVALLDPDAQGQPRADERAALTSFRDSLDAALAGQGRVVATITMDGVREHIAHVSSSAVVEGWQQAPPQGFGSHDAQVQLIDDPEWQGLREIAGLLG
jgi:hypothetical protein